MKAHVFPGQCFLISLMFYLTAKWEMVIVPYPTCRWQQRLYILLGAWLQLQLCFRLPWYRISFWLRLDWIQINTFIHCCNNTHTHTKQRLQNWVIQCAHPDPKSDYMSPFFVLKQIFLLLGFIPLFFLALLLSPHGSHGHRLIISWDLLWEMISKQSYHRDTATTTLKAKPSAT